MTNQTAKNISLTPLKPEEINEIITTLDEWLKDDSGYDELTWPELKIALDQQRDLITAQRLFDE